MSINGFDAFCAQRQQIFRSRLAAMERRVLRRKAEHHQLQLRRMADFDLDQQPCRLDSHMGPKARNLSEIEGDSE